MAQGVSFFHSNRIWDSLPKHGSPGIIIGARLDERLSMAKAQPEWITVREAAELAGYTGDHIRRLIKNERITARKVSIVWLVDRHSLVTYLKSAEQMGQRRGPKSKG